MKVRTLTFPLAICAMLASVSSLTMAQTCVAGIQASNPTSVYLVDNVKGTVSDSRTGLMWDRCALGLSGPSCVTGTASVLTWQAALDAAANVGTFKGYSDWRLPNLREFRSLVEECRSNPAINEFAFPNTPVSFYWSCSPYAGGATFALGLYFGSGDSSIESRSFAARVRLVRAAQ